MLATLKLVDYVLVLITNYFMHLVIVMPFNSHQPMGCFQIEHTVTLQALWSCVNKSVVIVYLSYTCTTSVFWYLNVFCSSNTVFK